MMYFQTHLVVIAVVVVVLTAVVAYLCVMGARRLDRLHQRILANRDALSRLLVRRASETLLLASEDALGARAGACLTEVANASVADSADQLSCDGLDRRSGAAPAADPVDVRRCLEKASALSRAIRDTLDDDTRRQLAAREPDWRPSTRPATASSWRAPRTTRTSPRSVPCAAPHWCASSTWPGTPPSPSP